MEPRDLYVLMFDTLLMIEASGIDIPDDVVSEYLEEIEGDNHTFLHVMNVSKLGEAGLLNGTLVNTIVILRQYVSEIPAIFWNVKSFRENEIWLSAHKLANEILSQLQAPDVLWPTAE